MPAEPGKASDRELRHQQEWALKKLTELLENSTKQISGGLQSFFEKYLRTALKISPFQVLSLMWDPPRALFTSAIPTLRRRLSTEWQRYGEVGLDHKHDHHPLPDFVQRQLFGSLNSPDVIVEVPARDENYPPREEYLPLVQALSILTPGNVTRRFATFEDGVSHWAPVPVDASQPVELRISAICHDVADLGFFID